MTDGCGPIKKINDICLFVTDFDRSLEYYQNVFGLKIKRAQPNAIQPNYIEFDFHGTGITMWDRRSVISDAIPEEFLGSLSSHNFMIAIKLDTPDQVTQTFNRLKARGAKFACEPKDFHFGSRACYMLDYENNIWELFSWFEDNGPGLLANGESK